MKRVCFRCSSNLEDVTPEDSNGIKFYSCKSCSSQYSENIEGRLFDRWLMPITIPLYCLIFEDDHKSKVEDILNSIMKEKKSNINILVKHISDELENPKQRISDIHNFEHLSEENLREFLKLLLNGIKHRQSKSIVNKIASCFKNKNL